MIQFAAALGSTPSAIVRSNRSVDAAVGDQHARDLGLEAELGRVRVRALTRGSSGSVARMSSTHASAGSSGGMSGSGKYR